MMAGKQQVCRHYS